MDFEKLILKGKARVAVKNALTGNMTHRDVKAIIAFQTPDITEGEFGIIGKETLAFIYELRCVNCN